MSTLSLNDVVDVSVTVGPVSSVRTNFNLGLIIGSSAIITTTSRVKVYSKMNDLLADHWTGNEPEYLAAQKYFSQNPRPHKLAIGRWDNENETAVQAVQACRIVNTEWYICTVLGAEKTEIIAIANYIDSVEPASTYFYTTSDSDVKSNIDGNIMDILKKNGVHRTLGQYSTSENAVVAIMGYAMGANKQTDKSAYTLAFKSEVGVTTENLTSTEVSTIEILNGNVYVNRGTVYNIFEPGKMADGTYFDELLGLDVLTNGLQAAAMNALTTEPKVAQEDSGIDKLLNYLRSPLEKARGIGFISSGGKWTGANILTVETGDVLPRGYEILSEKISDQSQEDREARIAPPIYIPIKLAGAIQHVTIGVYVNR